MDDPRREFVSNDGIRWQYSIEHRTNEENIAWRAHVWEADDYRGVLEGCVWTTEQGDPDAICSIALKMALDANYLRDFAPDADNAPAESIMPAQEPAGADDPGIAPDPEEPIAPDPAENSDSADGIAGPDPLPSPA